MIKNLGNMTEDNKATFSAFILTALGLDGIRLRQEYIDMGGREKLGDFYKWVLDNVEIKVKN